MRVGVNALNNRAQSEHKTSLEAIHDEAFRIYLSMIDIKIHNYKSKSTLIWKHL